MDINQVIADVVPGRSFVDIGGLWGTVNQRVTVALQAGAASATMADICPLDHPLWADFHALCAAQGVSGYRSLQADLDDPALAEQLGVQDVVHCSGVIYHCPDPFRSLAAMRRVARRQVLIGSMTVPTRVENAAGVLDFSGGSMISVPALGGQAKAVMAAHFSAHGLQIANINAPAAAGWRWPGGAWNYDPWWWLWTAETLAGMAEAAGLRVRHSFEAWAGLAHYLVCEVG